jgi:hypothetical protein
VLDVQPQIADIAPLSCDDLNDIPRPLRHTASVLKNLKFALPSRHMLTWGMLENCAYCDTGTLSMQQYSRLGSVGITTDYGLDDQGSIPAGGKRFFCTPQRPDLLWSSPILISNRYLRPFPGGEAAEDHWLPSNTDVRNGGAVPPLPRMSSWHNNLLNTGTNFRLHLSLLQFLGGIPLSV